MSAIMKTIMSIAAAVLFFASLGFAEKETPMPKDLPPYGPEKPLAAPSVRSVKLDNGLTVWLVSKPGFPKVAITVAVRGGFAADPADRPGISELLCRTIDQGTQERNAKQIAQELQAAGGDLNAIPRKDYIAISTAVLASKLEVGVKIVSDILQNASFPEAEVTLAKHNLQDSLRQQESEPAFLAARAMAKVLFGNHPYHVTAPTLESVGASTTADLRSVYSQRFRPDQTLLVVVGDFDSARILDMAKANLGAWKAPAQAPTAAPARPTGTPEHTVFVIPRPDSVQTTLQLGTFGPLRSDPDYEATVVANAIYGGTFGSRLTTNIREDKGYTYSPFSNLSTNQVASILITRADVRNAVTGPSLNEIEYELNRVATTSPTEQELSRAKRYLVGSQAIRLQSRNSVAGQLAGVWVDGLPPEEIGNYGQKVAATTSADVDAAAKKYFPAFHAAIVAVGEEKVIREGLAPLGIPIKTLQ